MTQARLSPSIGEAHRASASLQVAGDSCNRNLNGHTEPREHWIVTMAAINQGNQRYGEKALRKTELKVKHSIKPRPRCKSPRIKPSKKKNSAVVAE